MPRPQVYGKRSRAIYNPTICALSSPEQPSALRQREERKPVQLLSKESKTTKTASNIVASPKRIALGVKSHNEVVLSADSGGGVEETSKTHAKNETDRGEEDLQPVRKRRTRKKQPSRSLRTERASEECQEDAVLEERTAAAEKQNDILPRSLSVSPKYQHDVKQKEVRMHTDEPQTVYTTHCKSLLELSSHPLTCFQTWSEELSQHFNVVKIAEASFGEVYRLCLCPDDPDYSRGDESVFKIIPLQPPASTLPTDKRRRNAAVRRTEGMSEPEDVATEVRLLDRMSAVPGFTNFRDVRVLQGRPAPAFAQAFRKWNAGQKAAKKEPSQLPDPGRKASYEAEQLWGVIEMQDAGTDLERLVEAGVCGSIWTVWDVFWQVVLSLAKGEEAAEFEHRDLHLGNICVRFLPSFVPDACSQPAPRDAVDPSRRIGFTPLETTIIDYTISRCRGATSNGNDSSVAYTDLARDPALFEGDSSAEYQYEIYRLMREVVAFGSARADASAVERTVAATRSADGETWERYHPQTNVVWLHFVLHTLLGQVEWPSALQRKPSRKQKAELATWKRALELEDALRKVAELLDPRAIPAGQIRSAGQLVLTALDVEGWLETKDVIGHGASDDSALVSQLEGLVL